MRIKITRNPDGGLSTESVHIDKPLPTRREVLDRHRADRAEARKSNATRVVESHQNLEITPEIDMRPIVTEGRTPCPECGFSAATATGLAAHMRAKHRVNVAHGE